MQVTIPTPRASEPRERTGGRAVECTGLENRQGCKPFVGSNPTLSASLPITLASVLTGRAW